MTFQELHTLPFLPIATERLLLRPISMNDAEHIATLLNNFNVTKTVAQIPYPYSLQDAHEFISLKTKEMNEGQDRLVLSIFDRKTQNFLGVIGYEQGSIGYWLGEPFWGQGIMKEAFKAFIHFLFDMNLITQFEISAMQSNQGSVRIIEGAGCKPTEAKELYSKALEKERPAQFYQLTAQDYWAKYESEKVPVVWVAAAALLKDKKLLLTERPEGKSMAGVWELPGGKIEQGETPEEALARELYEELGITVKPHELEPLTFASYRYEKFHLVMPFFTLDKWEGTLEGKEGQRMEWVKYSNLTSYPTPAADIALFHTLYKVMYAEKLWQ